MHAMTERRLRTFHITTYLPMNRDLATHTRTGLRPFPPFGPSIFTEQGYTVADAVRKLARGLPTIRIIGVDES